MQIKCFKCKKSFVPSNMNTIIVGPDVKVTCPFCGHEVLRKLNKFVGLQVGPHLPLSPNYAYEMIKLAEFIELNSSDYYKEKGLRHGKKKVRNLRNREQSA